MHNSQYKNNNINFNTVSLKNFEILEKLGSGGMGSVRLGSHVRTGKLYALKFVPMIYENNIKEGLILSPKLNHINLLKQYGHFYDEYKGIEYVIIVSEFIQGVDMYDIYFDSYIINRTRDPTDYIIQIATGLKYLHSMGCIHRDIKLENIIITLDNVVKIIDYDFLIDGYDPHGSCCGTLNYISPEILNNEFYDESTDVWSLGISIYCILTCKYPFDGKESVVYKKIKTLHPNMTDIPSEWLVIVSGLLQKDPKKRMNLNQLLNLINSM